ncbi:MAG: response regulator transcription factor [Candidatus Marinimicrobia bacterium]|nr:response regulator transcription factor [Candidatus Neomarinimicrobiota bacterium]
MSEITVLVVEDHTIVRQGIVSLINKEDDITIVGEADDGRQAIKLCREKKPNIIVMDLAMPHLNGIETTQIVKKECPKTNIIILSMYSEEEYIFKAIDAGASGYLTKKNAAEDLIKAIRAVRDGKTFFSPEVSKTVMNSYHLMMKKYGTLDEVSEKNKLTSRELEVLQLIAEGYTSKKISEKLHISTNTVQRHREKIMRKTGIHNVAGLTRYALEKGIIELE